MKGIGLEKVAEIQARGMELGEVFKMLGPEGWGLRKGPRCRGQQSGAGGTGGWDLRNMIWQGGVGQGLDLGWGSSSTRDGTGARLGMCWHWRLT